MTLLLQILFWIFAVFFIVLFLLLFLLCFPVKLFIDYYQDEKEIAVKFLGFKIILFPIQKGKSKKQNKKQKQGKPKSQETQDIGEKKPSFLKDFETIKQLLGKATRGMLTVLKSLKITNVLLEMSVGASNPALTGILYGQLCAGVYSAKAFMDSLFHIEYKKIVTQPDFVNDKVQVNFSCIIALRPIIIVVIGIQIGFVIVKRWIKYKFAKKR